MIAHLSPNGRIGMVLANGSLSSNKNGEGEIRKNIIEADLVECIIALPAKLFYNTQISACLWFLNRNKKQPGKILFIDARDFGISLSKTLKQLTEKDIKQLSDIYFSYVKNGFIEQTGLYTTKTIKEVIDSGCSLIPGNYIKTDDLNTQDLNINKLDNIINELNSIFAESRKLENIINVNWSIIEKDFR